jgi:hypothetical protein
VEVRSLGYRTDLAILALEGSEVTDRGDHFVIRSPGIPDYWWGNFLLLRDLKPGSGSGWLASFAAEDSPAPWSGTPAPPHSRVTRACWSWSPIPRNVAMRVYCSVGFTVTEHQLGFIRQLAG